MRRGLLIGLICLAFVSCSFQKKAVEKTISIEYKGERRNNISQNGIHPMYVSCKIKAQKDAPKIEIYFNESRNDVKLVASSDSPTSESLQSFELSHGMFIYKNSLYSQYDIYVDGELASSKHLWNQISDFSESDEVYYVVYE